MSDIHATAPLDISIVRKGFYQGFNPVVAMTSKFLALCLVLTFTMMPGAAHRALDMVTQFTLSFFAGWYIYLMAAFVALLALLVLLPISGRVRLGAEDAVPEHSTTAWLSMMFCSGIGIGILVFSVSEPISHFVTNPDIIDGSVKAGSAAAVTSSLRFVFLHWGFSAWCCYAVVGLALGLACHRYGQPMTMRCALAPLLGRRLEGALGHAIDIVSILAIIAGITTTIVLGLEQIVSGLYLLTGAHFFADKAGSAPFTALMAALVVAIATAIASVVSGVDRGVKWISQLGILLSFGVLIVFVVFGARTRVFSIFGESTLHYLIALPRQIVTLYHPGAPGASVSGSADRVWQDQWTIFYWAWWIAFAPFVGLFLARISRGRTVREFILGAVLAPTFMCFVWFSATGGSAILLELDGIAGGRLIAAHRAYRIYEAIALMLPPGLATMIKAVLVLLFLVLIVASSTAAIIAIKSIGAAGSDHAETPMHSAIWAFVIAGITGAVMAVGGIRSIRDVMIVGAVPFSVIMALMLPALALMLLGRSSPGPARHDRAKRKSAELADHATVHKALSEGSQVSGDTAGLATATLPRLPNEIRFSQHNSATFETRALGVRTGRTKWND